MDLAEAHLVCLKSFDNIKYDTFNVGLGMGISVLELINTFEDVNKVKVRFKIGMRRLGDAAECYADTSNLNRFNWSPKYDYKNMCIDSWNQRKG